MHLMSLLPELSSEGLMQWCTQNSLIPRPRNEAGNCKDAVPFCVNRGLCSHLNKEGGSHCLCECEGYPNPDKGLRRVPLGVGLLQADHSGPSQAGMHGAWHLCAQEDDMQ